MNLHLSHSHIHVFFFFFFNDTATTEIYTLSLHDALPILEQLANGRALGGARVYVRLSDDLAAEHKRERSEEHTSELQSPCNLVCRLLLEKKKKTTYDQTQRAQYATTISHQHDLYSVARHT